MIPTVTVDGDFIVNNGAILQINTIPQLPNGNYPILKATGLILLSSAVVANKYGSIKAVGNQLIYTHYYVAPTNDDSGSGLGAGAIVGIVCAIVAVIAIVGIWRYRKRNTRFEVTDTDYTRT
jgi:hypothetical protein